MKTNAWHADGLRRWPLPAWLRRKAVQSFGRHRFRTNLRDRLVKVFPFFEAKGGKRRFIPLGDQIQIRTAAVVLAAIRKHAVELLSKKVENLPKWATEFCRE